MNIEAVPTEYHGTRFRSTLEADWAATFDSFRWYWQYEPEAVRITTDDGVVYYRPDFYLPDQHVWAEVKGPHNERLAKTEALRRALWRDPWDPPDDDPFGVNIPLVVVLRAPGPGETCAWEETHPSQRIVLAGPCPECDRLCFMDYHGIWACRHGCFNGGENKWWTIKPHSGYYRPNEYAFTRAPRERR